MLTVKEQELLNALEPQAQEHGIEIVTVEVVGAKKAPTIKIYIDTPDGVSFDQLAAAQAWIGPLMDDLDPFPGAYTLEVSSPGIDRPLRTPEHFERFAGETATFTLKKKLDGRGRFTGTLKGFADGCVQLEVDGAPVALEVGNLKRARLIGTVDFKK